MAQNNEDVPLTICQKIILGILGYLFVLILLYWWIPHIYPAARADSIFYKQAGIGRGS